MYDRLNAGPSGADGGAARLLLHAMMHGRNVVNHVASGCLLDCGLSLSLLFVGMLPVLVRRVLSRLVV